MSGRDEVLSGMVGHQIVSVATYDVEGGVALLLDDGRKVYIELPDPFSSAPLRVSNEPTLPTSEHVVWGTPFLP